MAARFGFLVVCCIQLLTHGTILTIHNGAYSHSTYRTQSKLSLTPNAIDNPAPPTAVERLDKASTKSPTLPPSQSPYQTKTNKASDQKSFSAMRENWKPHGWSENHNYGLDGDVLSQEQHEDVYFTNDQQWALQKNSPNIAMWVAMIFISICGVFIMCTCLCLMK